VAKPARKKQGQSSDLGVLPIANQNKAFIIGTGYWIRMVTTFFVAQWPPSPEIEECQFIVDA
jgi:hypothetical protein